MNHKIKMAIVRAARYGFNIPEIALNFCMNKSKITHKEYLAFCRWAKTHEEFYYWLRNRIGER